MARTVLLVVIGGLLLAPLAIGDSFVNWETPHVHPLELTPDGSRLLAVNTADARLEVFDVRGESAVHLASIPVGLDPVSATIFKDEVRKERMNGRTILLSSHLVNEVEEMADRIVYLQDGKPFFVGTMEEIKKATSEGHLDRALVRIMENAREANHGTRR